MVNNKKFNQFLLLGKAIGLVGIFIKQLKKCFKNAILGRRRNFNFWGAYKTLKLK